MTNPKVEQELEELKEVVMIGLGEQSALFMSNPKPGTEQVMPTRESTEIADKIISHIKEALSQAFTNGAISEVERLLEEHQFFPPTHKQLSDRLEELKSNPTGGLL